MSSFLNDLAKACPPETPLRFLRFAWFGDFACSAGEPSQPGRRLPLEDILRIVEKEPGPGLAENLGCWIVRSEAPREPSVFGWQNLCWKFYDTFKDDYLREPSRYSPAYPQLFTDQSEQNYLQVISRHANSGGAMRSAALAYGGAPRRSTWPWWG